MAKNLELNGGGTKSEAKGLRLRSSVGRAGLGVALAFGIVAGMTAPAGASPASKLGLSGATVTVAADLDGSRAHPVYRGISSPASKLGLAG